MSPWYLVKQNAFSSNIEGIPQNQERNKVIVIVVASLRLEDALDSYIYHMMF